MGVFYPSKPEKGFNEIVKLGTTTQYTGFGLINLDAEQIYQGTTQNAEYILNILSGKCTIEINGKVFANLGERRDVFSGKASGAYVPINSSFTITEVKGEKVEIAVLASYAERAFAPFAYGPHDVVSEHRGFLNFQRDVHNVVIEQFEGQVDRIVVGETIVKPGHWSGYPSHKHDKLNLPYETEMEEIYHFRIRPADGFGVQVIYNDDLSVRESYFLKDGDSVFIPDGYHPIAVAPGFQFYYLWVMAGPHGRILVPFDDPKLAWLNNVKPLLGKD
ncbi:5-deoxy-glucuronate isomerase [Anaerosporomusa subterranea]|uniref:5-deoxy-glucuronate isomerase n=1 Tax=Anaerosporomusa subterranea TaxID=1794912 RepID=A0A154BRT1_ANASB|nr:5-deoxy-glucuronate isomerase [Anaerosporomusa subterranea]KYZ76672.1 5-deoxy-glucuronate isomerase [Anaerosporomusa subterranea]MDF2502273.1 Myo-inositol catabolism protein IolB [Anaerosporomusa subterranea]